MYVNYNICSKLEKNFFRETHKDFTMSFYRKRSITYVSLNNNIIYLLYIYIYCCMFNVLSISLIKMLSIYNITEHVNNDSILEIVLIDIYIFDSFNDT